MMLNFLMENLDVLIERCRVKVAVRLQREVTALQLECGVPRFFDQLIQTLREERQVPPNDSRAISGDSGGAAVPSEIGLSAAQHGRESLTAGFTIEQVVRGYGDVCQSITDLASEQGSAFSVEEFRTLNRCLDTAIAEAVAEFSHQRDFSIFDRQALAMNERLGGFAHELRNFLQTAKLAFIATKSGNLSLSGATGNMLERSLDGLAELISGTLDEVRAAHETSVQSRMFSLAEFIMEVKHAADLAAEARGCTLTVCVVDPQLGIHGNRGQLFAALNNLLQNAFKFTHAATEVLLEAYAASDRILIDVMDHCGGLTSDAENLFVPFNQVSDDKSGLGLGLSIAKHNIESNQGLLSVRDIPGTGCVFTISLPRYAMQR